MEVEREETKREERGELRNHSKDIIYETINSQYFFLKKRGMTGKNHSSSVDYRAISLWHPPSSVQKSI